MSFEIVKEQQGERHLLKFCGGIDEEAHFPDMPDLSSEVLVDLKEVSAINSIGIRSWIMFFTKHGDKKFIFSNCPKALVMQMNMVEGFLPPKAQIISLQVPFFCEDCDEEKDVMFEVGKEIQVTDGGVKLQYDKTSICSSGCDPELDVSETKYFKFLNADKIAKDAA